MQFRILAAVGSMACLLGLPCIAAAQNSDVTFNIPLRLTQLSGDITKVQVACTVDSPGVLTVRDPSTGVRSSSVTGYVIVPVTGGQVVTEKPVVVAIDVNTFDIFAVKNSAIVGKAASYRCRLTGYYAPKNMWSAFSDTNANVAFRLSPPPADITGKFTW